MLYLLTSSQCLCKYLIWTVYTGAPTYLFFVYVEHKCLQTCIQSNNTVKQASSCSITYSERNNYAMNFAIYPDQDQLCAFVLWSENLSRQLPKWVESPPANENEAFSVSACCQTLPRTHFRCPDQLEGNIICLLHSVKSVEKYAWGHNVSKSADLQLLTLESEMHESVWGCSFRHNSEHSVNVIGLKWAHLDKQFIRLFIRLNNSNYISLEQMNGKLFNAFDDSIWPWHVLLTIWIFLITFIVFKPATKVI